MGTTLIRPGHKPKILYFYQDKELHKHEVTSECWLEIVEVDAVYGVRYRCRGEHTDRHDHYGYSKQKEAKQFEMNQTLQRIRTEQEWYKKLNKADRVCEFCGPDGDTCDQCSGDGFTLPQAASGAAREGENCPHCRGTKKCPTKLKMHSLLRYTFNS